MILPSTSAAAAVPFTPTWSSGKHVSPTFLLRAGSVIERGQMEAEVTGQHAAGPVYAFELKAAMRDGAAVLFEGEPELDQVLSLIDAEPADVIGADKQLLSGAEKALAEHWPPYRDLLAQAARRGEILPIVALRRFCVGVDGGMGADGGTITFVRAPDGQMAEATLAKLHPLDLATAGVRAYSLQYGRDPGNSQPASQSDEAPATSNTDAPSPTGGKSKVKRGAKTPA